MKNVIGIRILKMKIEYLDRVIKLGFSTSEFQTGTETPQFYSKQTLAKWINSPNGILLVAKSSGDEFAGFSITAYNPDSRDAYVDCIVVVDKFRRKGVGDKLLAKTFEELKNTDCNHIYCLVEQYNGISKRFFEKHDFKTGNLFYYTDKML